MPDENFEMWRDIAAGQQRQRTEKRLEDIEQLLAKQQANIVAKCPYCDGDLSKIGVEVCKHCGKELLWYEGIVYKEGDFETAKIKHEALICARARRDERYNELTGEIHRLKTVWDGQRNYIFAGIMALLLGIFAGFGYIADGSPELFTLSFVLGVVVFLGSIFVAINNARKNDALNHLNRIKAAEEELSRL